MYPQGYRLCCKEEKAKKVKANISLVGCHYREVGLVVREAIKCGEQTIVEETKAKCKVNEGWSEVLLLQTIFFYTSVTVHLQGVELSRLNLSWSMRGGGVLRKNLKKLLRVIAIYRNFFGIIIK